MSTVIIGLIIYTMTIDKKKSIATLKLIGAPDRRIIGLIVQQALAMGVISFLVGVALINAGARLFSAPRGAGAGDAATLFGVVLLVACWRARSACVPRSRSIPRRRSRVDHDRTAGCRDSENISKHFGEGPTRVDALRDVSLDVYPGTVIGLRGPSGSGKSTLLNVIGCILEPNSGSMRLERRAGL